MDEPPEEKPVLKMAGIKHAGCVNRVKYNKIGKWMQDSFLINLDLFTMMPIYQNQ